jgi:long-chain acyl-CoA synthetase
MQGYWNRPDENEKAFTPDGGLRTGDLGYIDDDGFLYVTGRLKEQYKLANGKYVMPGPLEEQLKLSPYVANAMLHGANRPYNVALVVLDEPAVRQWASRRGLELADLTRDRRVEQLITEEVRRFSTEFRRFEVPRRVLLVAEDFTTENDLLTPTLKLKRRNVTSRYGAALEALYIERAEDRATHLSVW